MLGSLTILSECSTYTDNMARTKLTLASLSKRIKNLAGPKLRSEVSKSALHKITLGFDKFTDEFPRAWQDAITAFKEAGEKASALEGATDRSKFFSGGVTFTVGTYRKIKEGTASFALIRDTFNRLGVELEEWELGHLDTSILAIRVAAYRRLLRKTETLASLDKIYYLLVELDKLTLPDSLNQDTWNKLIKSIETSEYTVDYTSVFGDGTGQVNLTVGFESVAFNQKKGLLSRRLRGIFDRVLRDSLDGAIEDAFRDIDFTDISNSPTFFEDMTNFFYDIVDPKRKAKTTRRKGSKTQKVSVHLQKPKSMKRLKKPADLVAKKTAQPSRVSLQQLIPRINQSLPEVVKKNMGPPRLVNRTGQFAESAEVVEIIRTPKGFPSIGYTYDKTPYQVFEMGRGAAPWATPERDPRRVIEQSIREIASSIMQGRFYMRRL